MLHGHIARHNPQIRAIESGQEAVIVFRGPHSYVSPAWYSKPEAVPTWNFAVIHASGRLKPVTSPDALHALLARLVAKFEGPGSAYDFAKLPGSYIQGMIGGILGFEMAIGRLEGKFKLGQERSDADKQGILQNLKSARPARSLYELTADFYKRG